MSTTEDVDSVTQTMPSPLAAAEPSSSADAEASAAVSYTHLDVYKRQPHPRGGRRRDDHPGWLCQADQDLSLIHI